MAATETASQVSHEDFPAESDSSDPKWKARGSSPSQASQSNPRRASAEHVDRGGHKAHRQGKDLRAQKRLLDALEGRIPPPQLRTPPDNSGRFQPRLAGRHDSLAGEGLLDEDQFPAGAAS